MLVIDSEDGEEKLRAVVFVTRDTAKGTNRSAQEYAAPLLVLSGAEYASVPFAELVERISAALRGSRSRVVLEMVRPDGTTEVVFEDGTSAVVPRSDLDDA